MTSSSASTATPSQHAFDQRLDEVKPPKFDINSLIMDYLINEGYPDAARKFAVEANLQPLQDSRPIQQRVRIRNAINAGEIQTAIECINDINPQILDSDPALHFELLRLQLVELIRKCTADGTGDIAPALEFATDKLAPRASTRPDFLEMLEQTMALLLFPPDNLIESLSGLLDLSLRQNVANMVNEAILHSQGSNRNAKIRYLVRMRTWAEGRARESNKISPGLDLSLKLSDEQEDNAMQDARDDTESM